MKFAGYDWWKFDIEEIEKIKDRLIGIKNTVQTAIQNKEQKYFLKMCSREKISFQMISELVFKEKMIEDSWKSYLEDIYKEKFDKQKQTIRKIALLSIISFLISKLLIAFAVEIPLDLYFFKSFSIQSIAVNIILPPLLMMIIVFFIRMPSKNNINLIEKEIEIITENEEKKYIVSAPKNHGIITKILFQIAYFITLILLVYFISKILTNLKFSPPSIIIFLIFTSVVTATGVKIHNRSKELSLEKNTPSMLSFLGDLIVVPFMVIGKWTIAGISQFNILVIIFNFLIELPMQLFVEFLENFRSFIKEKKEENN
jgi:Na+/proline symporter